jgi:hypothetical protein
LLSPMQPYPFLLIFKLINRAFLMSAVTCGLDSVILDPTDPQPPCVRIDVVIP